MGEGKEQHGVRDILRWVGGGMACSLGKGMVRENVRQCV